MLKDIGSVNNWGVESVLPNVQEMTQSVRIVYDGEKSDVELNTMSKSIKLWFKEDINMQTIEFKVSMLFSSIGVIRYAMKIYEIRHGRMTTVKLKGVIFLL